MCLDMCACVCACIFVGLLRFFLLFILCVMAIISIPTKVNGASERTSGEEEHPESTHKERKITHRMDKDDCVCVGAGASMFVDACVCTFICSQERYIKHRNAWL